MGYPPQQPPPGYGPPGGGYGGPPGGEYGPPGGGPGQFQPPSNTPLILSIIGIVCWFCCAPISIALGLVAQGQFRRQGRSDLLAKVAWIGGIVFLVLSIVFTAISLSTGTYQT
jgi:preprotein translocase subunit SecG